MNPTHSESDLIKAVQGGETASFAELIEQHQGSVLRYFMLHHRLEDAMDLTQETFLAAWKSIKTYNPHWKFSTWLLAIAHQQNALFFRKQARLVVKQFVEMGESSDWAELEIPDVHLDFQLLAQKEEAENLWNLIRRNLSSEQAEMLWLFYVEEKSLQEIAEIMKRTVPGVKTVMFRAREALRVLLDGHLNE